MSIKEYLKQYRKEAVDINKSIKAIEERIQTLRAMQERVSSNISIVNVQKTPNNDRIADISMKILDLENKSLLKIEKLLDLQEEKGIEILIDTIDKELLKTIMYERYINLKKWKDVAKGVNYSESYVKELHGEILKKLRTFSYF